MLVFAPHANSWRRFASQSYAPVSPTWGVNNRSVALRIPAGDIGARRIEHRVAGGDVNNCILSLIAAHKAGIALDWNRACAIDLATKGTTKTVLEAVKTSINQLTDHGIESRLTLDRSTIQIGKNVF